jgi:hypothetical protein
MTTNNKLTEQDHEYLCYFDDNRDRFNCYNFATNCRKSTPDNKLHPGISQNKKNYLIKIEDVVCYLIERFYANLQRDGLVYTDKIFLKTSKVDKNLKVCSFCYSPEKIRKRKQGHSLVCAFLSMGSELKNKGHDFHFYRQLDSTFNGEFIWAHKCGDLEPMLFDASGDIITNPVKSDRKFECHNEGKIIEYNYNIFLGYYYVPKEGTPQLNKVSDKILNNFAPSNKI